MKLPIGSEEVQVWDGDCVSLELPQDNGGTWDREGGQQQEPGTRVHSERGGASGVGGVGRW